MNKIDISNKLINILLKYNDKDFKKSKLIQFKNKKILITGGSGLIGLKTVFFLIAINKKYDLKMKITLTYHTILFNFVKNFFKKLNFVSLTKINLAKNKISEKKKFDFIFHFAGYGQPTKFMNFKKETFSLNSLSIFNLSKNLKKDGVFVFLSTSEIYSGNTGVCNESTMGKTMPNHFRSPYIESKRFAESYILNNFQKFFIFRVCLNYGPGVKLNDDRVLNQVILRSLTDNVINVFGGFNQFRANLYIDDSIALLMNTVLSNKYDIYNLSSEENIKLGNIFKLISKMAKKEIKNNDKSLIKGAPNKIKISNDKIMKLTKIKPRTSLKEGLKITYDWYRYLLLFNDKKLH